MITGVLDSLERNEAEDLIRKYGGRTVNAVSSKVNYIIVGDEAGPAKLSKVRFYGYTHVLHISFVSCLYEISFQASSLAIKQISEDDLLEMIRTKPEGKAENIKPTKVRSNVKKILNKSESDKSPSPNKGKALSDLVKKIKTPPSSPVRTNKSPVSKQISDISNNTEEKVNLD